MSSGALAGVRVVDLTRVMSGPYATMMLGDMGADVIKIEQPGKGDDTRAWGPPFIDGISAYYLSVNRNKRSLTLNLKSDAAREIVLQLVDGADVVVENFSPGTAARLGLDYQVAQQRKPDIVYCSISGFGQDGPARDRTAYDLIVQGMSGLMSVTGPPGEPTRFGVPIADMASGMFAAFAITSALVHREKTGQGQYIDTSMFGGQVALLTYQAGIFFATGRAPDSTWNAHPIIAPYQTVRSRDGYVNIAVGNDTMFARFCSALGLEQLPSDPHFVDNAARIAHREALIAQIEQVTQQYDTAEIVVRLDAAAVPCGPIYSVPQALDDPQARFYGLQQSVPHPTLGSVQQTGFPYVLAATPCAIRRPPPLLGQHSEEVLSELGYGPDAIDSWRAQGVI